jgi:uncharacterized membrane protein
LWIAGNVSRHNFPGVPISAQTVSVTSGFKRATVKETTVLLAVAWLIPFLVHLLPWSGERPLGAHLLPMFWAAFVAVYFFGLRVGLLVGLFAPALNLLLTGLPALRWLSLMGLELTLFTLFTWWTVQRAPRFWLIAPLGYVVAKIASTLVQLALAPVSGVGASSGVFLESLRTGIPGLVVLLTVNLALVLAYSKSTGPHPHDATGV